MLAVIDDCCDCIGLVAFPLELWSWAGDWGERKRRGDSRLINVRGMLASGWGRCCLLLSAMIALRLAAAVVLVAM